jgi:diguanylate cyclase (GGDEF)-like protein
MTWPPRWRQIGAVDGLQGDSYAVYQIGKELLVLGSSGVLAAPLDARGLPGHFTARPWTTGEAFDLHHDVHGTLLAESYSLISVDGDRVTSLSGNDLYPRRFIPSRFHPERMWLGTEHGIAVLALGPQGWQLASRHRWVSVGINQIIERGVDTALIATTARGVVWARFDADASHLLESHELGAAEGIDYGSERAAELSEFDGGLVVSTERGLFRSTVTDRYVSDDVGGLAALLAPGERVRLARSPDGRDWAYSARSLFRREPGNSWIREEINSYRRGPFSEPAIGDNGIMIAAAGQLFMLDGSVMSRGSGAAQLLVTGIREHGTALTLDAPLSLDGPVQELSFTLGFTDYGHATPPRFRARLKNYDEGYGEWRDSAEFRYAALPPGQYRLQAEARDGDGAVHTLAPFDITVRPRWFERSDVRIALLALVALLLVAIGVGVTRLRVIHLKARNRELDAIIRSRTAELEHANTRLRDQAERDGLTGVANRRRFDTVLAEFQADCRARDLPMALILIDVDHFKAYNDSHGHLRGDVLLQNVAQTIAIQCRGRDGIAARYGGEEFALLLRGVDRVGIADLAEKTRVAVAELRQPRRGGGPAGPRGRQRAPAGSRRRGAVPGQARRPQSGRRRVGVCAVAVAVARPHRGGRGRSGSAAQVPGPTSPAPRRVPAPPGGSPGSRRADGRRS